VSVSRAEKGFGFVGLFAVSDVLREIKLINHVETNNVISNLTQPNLT
jgi:hypothetical protein